MKTFWSFVHKEFIHILRDARSTLIVLIMPMMVVLIFGYAISTEIHSLRLMAVVNQPSESIRKQLQQLNANPYFKFEGLIEANRIDDVLRCGKTDAVIVFDNDAQIQVIADASDANMSAAAIAYIQQALSDNSQTELHNENAVVSILRYNPQMKSAYMYVPGIMGMIFILICCIMTSVSIVREKETGTMEVLLVSPLRPGLIVIAKLVPFFVISCINLATILCLVHFAMGVPLISLGSIIALCVLYIILALAVGLFISTMVDKQIIALLISAMVMMLPIMMLSGMIFPIENLPTILRPLSYIVPATWFNEAIRLLMIEGVPFHMVGKQFAILAAMTIIVMTAAIVKFNDRLE